MAISFLRMSASEMIDFLLEAEDTITRTNMMILEGDLTVVEDALCTAEMVLGDILSAEDLLPFGCGEILVEHVRNIVVCINEVIDDEHRCHIRGRPQIPISEESLILLLKAHFSTTAIGKMLGVSSRTIRRRIVQYGMQDEITFSGLSDSELDDITTNFIRTHPNSGERSLSGFLWSIGIRIQRARVRESLKRIDPIGVASRFRQVLHRRKYNVCMPNSLWHIDGYHRLIKWRIVIHGGIDGYSRLPVYMKASTNNRAETVLDSFLSAVHEYGLPSRVRSDKGGENVLVSQFMLDHPERGPGRKSFITGRSVHNQRIERLWRDLFTGCISLYYEVFSSLQEDGLLDPLCNTDLFSLHYIYIPRINSHLDEFRQSYAHHRLRTEKNQTPYQLWTKGLLQGSGDAAAIQGVASDTLVRVQCNCFGC